MTPIEVPTPGSRLYLSRTINRYSYPCTVLWASMMHDKLANRALGGLQPTSHISRASYSYNILALAGYSALIGGNHTLYFSSPILSCVFACYIAIQLLSSPFKTVFLLLSYIAIYVQCLQHVTVTVVLYIGWRMVQHLQRLQHATVVLYCTEDGATSATSPTSATCNSGLVLHEG